MTANGLTLARQADLLIERIRGVPERRGVDLAVTQLPTVAEVVPLPAPAVALEADLALCRLDDKGRFHLAGLGDLLGWEPGDDLAVETRGPWLVLRRTGSRHQTDFALLPPACDNQAGEPVARAPRVGSVNTTTLHAWHSWT